MTEHCNGELAYPLKFLQVLFQKQEFLARLEAVLCYFSLQIFLYHYLDR